MTADKMIKIYFIMVALFILPGLSQLMAASLSQEVAKARADIVSEVSYKLFFDLRSSKAFNGSSEINFALSKTDDLRIDFAGGQVKELTVNGNKVPNPDYNGDFLWIHDHLKVGDNNVIISFNHEYSKNGDGLYRFVDPEDQKVYIYSNFEPYKANSMFPCFDQPDLKATYEMRVQAPTSWHVVSASKGEVASDSGAIKNWYFPKTKAFSTYIFSLHAGPYKVWEDKYQSTPLRLMARQSLAKYVKPNFWFEITKQGFQFFESYFSYPYPFDKYDQLIVPDFNAGAMENVGAVTFAERVVKRSEPDEANRLKLANYILHELAHMWFGNLVTMKWWDDLWLNESFATYMAHKALFSATRFKNAWKFFSTSMKGWAYWNDSLVVTHPIQLPVDSTDEAFTNFDGITYGKGASFLKQLNFYAGETAFKKGLASYFKKYAYQNTKLDDFVASIDQYVDEDLSEFTRPWLTTSGTNLLKVNYTCNETNGHTQIRLEQTAPENLPTMRRHKTRIGFYRNINGQIKRTDFFDITYSKAEESLMVKVDQCPDFVFGNDDDMDFANAIIDEKSLKYLDGQIHLIANPHLKIQVWSELWKMTTLGKLSMARYISMMEKSLIHETDFDVFNGFIYRHKTMMSILYSIDHPKSIDLRGRLADLVWTISTSDKDQSIREGALNSYIQIERRPKGASRFHRALEKAGKDFHGLKVDMDRQWDIVIALSGMDDSKAKLEMERLKKQDSSSRGKLNALETEVALSPLKVKKEWYQKIIASEASFSVNEKKHIMDGLIPFSQNGLEKKIMPQYFEKLPQVIEKIDDNIAGDFATSFVPLNCSKADSEPIDRMLQKHDFSETVVKSLRIAKQENERCEQIANLLKSQ